MNLTAQPPLSPTLTVGNLVQERQSMATFSAGVGSYGQSGNLLLGVRFGYGWGESLAANPYVTPNQWAVVDTTSYNVLVIFAGSTSLRSLERAVERIEHEIRGKPRRPRRGGEAAGRAANHPAGTGAGEVRGGPRSPAKRVPELAKANAACRADPVGSAFPVSVSSASELQATG